MARSSIRSVVASTPAPVLADDEQRLFDAIVAAWGQRRTGALRHNIRSVTRDTGIVRDFTAHSGLPPWRWTEDDFDAWCEHLAHDRRLQVSSQRHYQGAIRVFLDYLTANVKFRNDVRSRFGIEPRQICTDENCIPHNVENERSALHERRALTHNEIERLFDGIRKAALEAGRFHGKDYNPLRRDNALFYLIYTGGLRISEALSLNVSSFEPNPALPTFGSYGFIHVWGKGSRGSGPRYRSVPVTHPDLPPMLDWYTPKVRPEFLRYADPNESALFLSERGRRLVISSAEARFQKCLQISGLDGMGLTPHCLRHSSVTHESLRFSTEAVRRKHGHSNAAVTQGYMHIPDTFVDQEISEIIAREIEQARQHNPKEKS
ncbi:tyrosine-type recombinase/integrase [Thiomonas sp.]